MSWQLLDEGWKFSLTFHSLGSGHGHNLIRATFALLGVPTFPRYDCDAKICQIDVTNQNKHAYFKLSKMLNHSWIDVKLASNLR